MDCSFKRQKSETITETFEKNVKESNRTVNKILVGKVAEFCNSSIILIIFN